ncbi:hypothetical protein K443DRAFT_5351 [Laccaria amethystina LaAM-08-1]|uniref:Unplaced genomic scaffold K443scaffold_44, whole genome shotgun sequence n=1 Tax=Laccaria amethystina LaAM-08-1 TaxID=1095629 RepID=A0A0C9Y0Q7_9AGAR|nr:hypothetical protein K443DRAFT_5351 [Laccaria amethystina LaAM-08-1]
MEPLLLAHLASQHHTSEYNILKFGAKGSPVRYLPLSVHLPDQFKLLRAHQLTNALNKSWWPSDKSCWNTALLLGPSGITDHPDSPKAILLSRQLSAAIQDSLHPLSSSLKTSSSHPINISSIISSDLVPLISSHALLSSSPHLFPTVLHLPSSFTLDRFFVSRQSQSHTLTLPSHTQPLPAFTIVPQHLNPPFRTTISQTLQSTLSSRLAAVHIETCHRTPSSSDYFDQPQQIPLEAVFSDNPPSLSLTLSLPPPSGVKTPSSSCHPVAFVDWSDEPEKISGRPPIRTISLGCLSSQPLSHSYPCNASPERLWKSDTFTIGDLFLSSCPGKKVRLQGPVKGRGGVCRDLEADLNRIKQSGAGCIVCCLDDSELDFLGAPWPEYERCASNAGIDVLRLPIPEGLAPPTAAHLDSHLTDLINRYTLQGVPILVHCRGGVGRAGVIACCWIMKLGLCGWIDEVQRPSKPQTGTEGTSIITEETLHFIEKVIMLVRRRRSVKAVETYEQVKFLVDFVEFLRQRSKSEE